MEGNKEPKVSAMQIAEWKKKYGDIFRYKTTDGKECYFRRPTRAIMEASMMFVDPQKPFAQKQFILKNCFVGGDETLISEASDGDKYFYDLGAAVDMLLETVGGELKKV